MNSTWKRIEFRTLTFESFRDWEIETKEWMNHKINRILFDLWILWMIFKMKKRRARINKRKIHTTTSDLLWTIEDSSLCFRVYEFYWRVRIFRSEYLYKSVWCLLDDAFVIIMTDCNLLKRILNIGEQEILIFDISSSPTLTHFNWLSYRLNSVESRESSLTRWFSSATSF